MEKFFNGNGVTMLTPAEQKEIVGGASESYWCGKNKNLKCKSSEDCPGVCICNSALWVCVEYMR